MKDIMAVCRQQTATATATATTAITTRILYEFVFFVQISAFFISTSLSLPNLNKKEKAK